jgi:alpha-L-fucosidase 2
MLKVKGKEYLIAVIASCWLYNVCAQPQPKHDLQFDSLATSWDEGLPLGNGMIGGLIWQRDNQLRISLDRADLWDLRPMKGLDRPEFSYQWIAGQVKKAEYPIVQKYFDSPYETEPAPSKIPGGALEFNIQDFGPVAYARLSVQQAMGEVKWRNGTIFRTFVHATLPIGWFRIENLKTEFQPELVAPRYEGEQTSRGGSVDGDDLSRLGYTQGKITRKDKTIIYRQEGWGGFQYEIALSWKQADRTTIEGTWSISSHYPGKNVNPPAHAIAAQGLKRGYGTDLKHHLTWWNKFWNQSALHVPDPMLEKQWYLEQYKFGSAARRGAPPISLQAVWTADNGRIPPWKGDYHHDLNTQLSYWPAYSGNHLEEGLGYFDHLEENKVNYKRYTKTFFGTDGLAVPGVTTLNGTEMGGWTQYSLSPTVSAWLAHHYYLHWRYSMDRVFLEKKAYPWLKDVALHLEQITVKGDDGLRKLPLSSSPEVNNNAMSAWFQQQNTNYDLALMRFTFGATAELAAELGQRDEATHFNQLLNELPDYALSENDEFKFAPDLPYNESHRHFSHVMAIHPLSLVRWEDGERSQKIIRNTIALLDKIGPDWWCGYSYSWLGSIKARAKDGDGAAKTLGTFAKAFCLKNSFHVNGDQTRSGLSRFTYRPFTLEGNFAFAAGLQEMLLQSYGGFIEVMPAVPATWKDISFTQLRAEGAFLVSAQKVNGRLYEIVVSSEQGGKTRLKMPIEKLKVASKQGIEVTESNGFMDLSFTKGGVIRFENADSKK